MKICLVSEYFYPQSKGGTEKYVFELANKLILEGNEVEVITVSLTEFADYQYHGISVKVVKLANNLDLFADILTREKYNRIHFHTLTPAFDTYHIAVAQTTGAEIYFTAHIPAVTCIRGDLMQFGKIACDGYILKHRCTSCYISKKKIPKPFSNLIGGLTTLINYPKGISSAVEMKLAEISALNRLCNKVFIFTDWQKTIFIKNGFEPEKLVQVRQMEVAAPPKDTDFPVISRGKNKIKIGFVGRITYEKGLHILLDAFLEAKIEKLELHVAAIVPDKQDPYFHKLIKLSNGNDNIFWEFDLNNTDIQEFYQKVDLICIPSIWYETGPFVLYEAIKFQLPIIANNLGDMDAWRKKGYWIKTYNNKKELLDSLLKL
ncbi:glycosyltransferase [Pedobacter insulae]|uniref:Glycosyltransferase involved in cell wall bisynthesis n=1 Tax=Pedobacter insulae TaxID=414048 RepID=A0A1I2VXT1_9SPHI|nr:glycosyltransferase [Pedobacter insulae]SFG93137.1 Glycosyltransferase involved in cell wall bisynthesis [Pedobacter insulae]